MHENLLISHPQCTGTRYDCTGTRYDKEILQQEKNTIANSTQIMCAMEPPASNPQTFAFPIDYRCDVLTTQPRKPQTLVLSLWIYICPYICLYKLIYFINSIKLSYMITSGVYMKQNL